MSQAKPDIIFSMDSVSSEEQKRLNSIAEVCYLPSEENWRAHFLQTASFLNEESEAEKWLMTYDKQTSAAKKTFFAHSRVSLSLSSSAQAELLYGT